MKEEEESGFDVHGYIGRSVLYTDTSRYYVRRRDWISYGVQSHHIELDGELPATVISE
jgi:hypothetical protein